MAGKAGKRPKWKPPKAEEAEVRGREHDPEAHVFRVRRAWAMSRLEYLGRYGSDMVAFLCVKEILDRTDPKPREPMVAIDNRTYTWAAPVVVNVEGSERLSSSSPRGLSGGFTSDCVGSTCSSAIVGLGRPTWL